MPVIRHIEDLSGSLRENFFTINLADELSRYAANLRGQFTHFSTEAEATAADLWKLRKQLDDKIYGLRGLKDPGANETARAYNEIRGVFDDAIKTRFLDKKELAKFDKATRQFDVADWFEKFAQRGDASEAEGILAAVKRLYLLGKNDRPTGTFTFAELLAHELAVEQSRRA